MQFDYQAAQFWFSIANATVTLLVTVYVWQATRYRATKKDIDDMEDRLIRIEKDIEHAPNRSDIERLNDRISQVGNSVNGVQGELKQVNRTLQLINDHLLNHGGK